MSMLPSESFSNATRQFYRKVADTGPFYAIAEGQLGEHDVVVRIQLALIELVMPHPSSVGPLTIG